MNQVVTLRQREPDLQGTAKVIANGSVEGTRDKAGAIAVAVTRINAYVTASALQVGGRRLGNLELTANTVTSGGPAPVGRSQAPIQPGGRDHHG